MADNINCEFILSPDSRVKCVNITLQRIVYQRWMKKTPVSDVGYETHGVAITMNSMVSGCMLSAWQPYNG